MDFTWVDHLSSIATLIGFPMVVISAWQFDQASKGVWKRPLAYVLFTIGFLAYGLDVTDRFWGPLGGKPPVILLGAGVGPPNEFHMYVENHELLSYGQDYDELIIGRVAVPQVDKMSDTAIAKSATYTIVDGTSVLEGDLTPAEPGRVTPGVENTFDITLVLIPKNLLSSQILCLNDVLSKGGKIIGSNEIVTTPNAVVP